MDPHKDFWPFIIDKNWYRNYWLRPTPPPRKQTATTASILHRAWHQTEQAVTRLRRQTATILAPNNLTVKQR